MLSNDMRQWPLPPSVIETDFLFTEDGNVERIVETLFAFYFWRGVEKAKKDSGGQIDLEEEVVRVRLMADAHNRATLQARYMSERFSRAFVALAWENTRSGAHRLDEHEPETVYEMIALHMMDWDEGEGHLSELSFMMEELFPMMEKLGQDPNEWLNIKAEGNLTKAISLVPMLRHQMKVYASTGETIEKEIEVCERRSQSRNYTAEERKGYAERLESLQSTRDDTLRAAAEDLVHIFQEALEIIEDKSFSAWGKDNGVKVELSKRIGSTKTDSDKMELHPAAYCLSQDGDKLVYIVTIPKYLGPSFQAAQVGWLQLENRGKKAMRNLITELLGEGN